MNDRAKILGASTAPVDLEIFWGAVQGYVRLRMEGCLRLDITKESHNSIAIYEGYVLVNMMKRPGARMVGGSVTAGKRAVTW